MSIDDERPLLAVIADADEESREILEAVLTGAGYDVLSVDDGPSLVGAAMIEQPDIIFIDLDLPEFDIGTTLGILRRDTEEAQNQIVLMSDNPRLPDIARELRADAVLAKPIDVDSLIGGS